MKLDIQLFASTNKTTHYNLSQYVSSDKPTYLVDYNDDMSAIDTAIYGAKTQADLGVTNASTAQTTAETAQSTANTAVTNAGTAQSTANANSVKIGDLANLNTTAKSNVVSAINEVKSENVSQNSNILANENAIEALANKFNLTSITKYTGNQMTPDTGIIQSYSELTIACNSDGSIAKIYGTIYASRTTTGSMQITITNTNLRPSEAITINPAGISYYNVTNAVIGESIDIATNGTITLKLDMAGNTESRHTFIPCLYFLSDFGDTQSNN